MNAVIYKSKRDLWLLVALGIGTLVCLFGISQAFHMPGIVRVLLLPVLGLGLVLPAWTVFATRYTLSDDALLVQSGPFSWRIALREVARISPSRETGSSPALSLDRLRIEYGEQRALLISPGQKAQFLQDFTARQARLQAAVSGHHLPG
jgi:Bacterial PH domain